MLELGPQGTLKKFKYKDEHRCKVRLKVTFAMDAEEFTLLFARFPRSICTEMFACDRSIPDVCSACVRLFSNLFINRE